MDLKAKIQDDIKEAMKAKDSDKVTALRGIHSVIKNREIELRPEALSDQELIQLLKKQCKQRLDSIEQFEKAHRSDLVDKEKKELQWIQVYLPAELSTAELNEIVNSVISDLKATSKKEMGSVIKEVISRSNGRADNKTVSEIVRARLG